MTVRDAEIRDASRELAGIAGLANVFGGLATAVYWFLHPGIAPENATMPSWAFASGLFVALLLALQLGLVGLYARQPGLGILGGVGFVLGFLGNGMFIGAGVIDAFVAPTLAREAPLLLSWEGALFGGSLGAYYQATGTIFLLGYILFGVTSARRFVFSPWACIAMALSAPILGLSPLMPTAVRVAGCMVFGAANIWLGWELLRFRARTSSRAVSSDPLARA